ncbi:MAG: DUF1599 domain-containing protein [Bacteroidales bacterium]|nr:DUF1599 domain-containing protein [Bacteroidales bacterium]MDY0217306.1 DUF1599 domain-containing protein [Bacteroidales bacterium]
MSNTSHEYNQIIDLCRSTFADKMKDYGTAWRILRTPSLTDQIYIKAQRIRSIQQNGFSKVDEGIVPEFIGIINYSIMALIQLELGTAEAENSEMNSDKVLELYNHHFSACKSLMEDKNHDYGEAWRNMRVSSLTDIILMKLLRVKQIEDNAGQTIVSEGLDANYSDMVNYAVFALIKLLN